MTVAHTWNAVLVHLTDKQHETRRVKHFKGEVWVSCCLTPDQGDHRRPGISQLVHRVSGFQVTERGYENQADRSSSLSSQMTGTDDTRDTC